MARSLMTQLRHQPRPMDLYPDRAGAGFHAIAAALLVYSRSVLIHLRNTYASHQNVVCLTMGHVITRFRRLDLAQSTWPQARYPGCLPPPQIRWWNGLEIGHVSRLAGARGRGPSWAPTGAIRCRPSGANGRTAQWTTCDPAGGRAAPVQAEPRR